MGSASTLNERAVCSRFITTALVAAGWDLQSQVRNEVGFITVAADHGDPEALLKTLPAAEQRADTLRDQLKAILGEALLR